jgi:hypothetical protein
MTPLVQHCVHHPVRPASARCPSCRQSFCRECVVEHEGRIICAGCLARILDAPDRHRKRLVVPIFPVVQAAVALIVLWWMFFLLAGVLRRVPADVHEGIIWTE